VLALQEDAPFGVPTIFKTYPLTDPSLGDCKIWEVGRATCASIGLYKSVKFGTAQIKFVAASSVCDDPYMMLVSEVCRVFPGRSIGCVLIVGTTGSRTINLTSKNTSSSYATPPIGLGLSDELVGKDHMSFRFRGSTMLHDVVFFGHDENRQCVGLTRRLTSRLIGSISTPVLPHSQELCRTP